MSKASILNVLAGFLIILVFATLIVNTLHPAISLTQDLGRHLKLGEIIWDTKSVPKINLFTYTNQEFPFINHHWLSEVIFFHLNNLLGINGLIVLKIVLLTLAFSIVVISAVKRSSLVFASLSSVVFLPLFLERTHIRPEIFSLAFFALFFLVLYKNHKFTNSLFIIPILLMLWVNLHIYFAAGMALLVFFVLENIFTARKSARHVLLLLVSSMVLLANPNTFKGALLPLKIFKSYGYSIIENQTPFFLDSIISNPRILIFKTSLILTTIAFTSAISSKKIFDVLSISFFTFLAFKQIRNFPLYALVMIPLVSNHIQFLVRQLNLNKQFIFKIGLAITMLVAITWQSKILVNYISPTDPKALLSRPAIALGKPSHLNQSFQFFKTKQLQGPIFNNFDIAGLAIYNLYPTHRLFVDNRPEAFPAEFFQQTYIPMQQNPRIFDSINNQYHFNSIIFAHSDITPWATVFLQSITQSLNWSIVYLDPRTVILVPAAKFPGLASQFQITQSNALEKLAPFLTGDNFPDLVRLDRFFRLASWEIPFQYSQQKIQSLITKR